MSRMGRPPLPLGHHGEIRVYTRGDAFQARTLVRDFDGHTRSINRSGSSRTAAKKALQAALRDRHQGLYGDVTPDLKVSVVAELWWKEWLNTSPSPTTKGLYRDRLDKQILPALGNLYVRELSVALCDRLIQTVATNNGTGLARTTRVVLSGICGYATKHNALPSNPVSAIGRIRSTKPRKQSIALTAEEAIDLRARYRVHQQAIDWDLPDLLDFLLATGLRISEACAVEWDDVDLVKGVVKVGDAVVVRERGVGLYIRFEKSNKLKERELELPSWMVGILAERKLRWHASLDVSTNASTNVVFPSPLGKLRDPSNTRADMRAVLQGVGYSWATSHTFRRTVASLMEEYGLGARAAADQLGHSQISMTQDRYFGRSRRPTGAKAALEHAIKEEETIEDVLDDEETAS